MTRGLSPAFVSALAQPVVLTGGMVVDGSGDSP